MGYRQVEVAIPSEVLSPPNPAIQDSIEVAAAVSAKTQDLGWLRETEREMWRNLVIDVVSKLLEEDINREKKAAKPSSPNPADPMWPFQEKGGQLGAAA